MYPVGKVGNEMKLEVEEIARRNLKQQSLNYCALLQLLGTVFLLSLQLSQLWSAGHRNCSLWFLQLAVRWDIFLHSHPLSVSVFVGVFEHVGRCAPPSWKCPKISQQHYTHLHNWASLIFERFDFFSLSLVFSVFTSFHSHSSFFHHSWAAAPNGNYSKRPKCFPFMPACSKCQELRQLVCGFETLQ